MLVFGLGIQVEAGVEAGLVRVDNGLPSAIQTDGRAAWNVMNQRGRVRGSVAKRRKRQQQEEQTSHKSLASRAILVRACDGVKPPSTLL